jgi:high-affinity nickel-transport protein
MLLDRPAVASPNQPGSVEIRKVRLLLGLLVAANIGAWLITWAASGRYAFLIATGWLAYAFGLRHAVDADHISAIDNTTRKLMRDGKRPLGVGLFFSLGHSTVVVLLSAALAVASGYVQHYLPKWQAIGSTVGTMISGGFLYIIGFVNLLVFCDLIAKARVALRSSEEAEQAESVDVFSGTGLLVRIFRPILRVVEHSWQMYFVGFLFGLGFDTASEVGMLAISARAGQSGLPFWVIMLLPLLFTVGMCLVDTLDGILMLGAYGWAQVKPIRKVTYNLTITAISVLVAFVVGTHEMLGMMNIRDLPKTAFWNRLDDNFGFLIVGLFASIWAISTILFKWRNRRATSDAEAA